jgi:dipeptidyl aminopeptidase/acylaminoacyl peptidase
MDERWKERFRARSVNWTRPSPLDRRRAVAMSDRSGKPELYAWVVGSPELRQLTDRPDGTFLGKISGDGRYVLWVEDRAGDELGHWVRMPFEGGPVEDLTPDLPAYASFSLHARPGGSEVLFTAASEQGHQTWLIAPDAAPGRRSVLVHQSSGLSSAAGLGADGSVAFVRTNERTGMPRFSLLAIDVADGRSIAELWDGPDSSIDEPLIISPTTGDGRVVGASDRSGDLRPFVWDAGTGTREDLALPGVDGDVVAWDWSPDGAELLLCQTRDAVQALHVLDPGSGEVRRLDHPGGTYGFWGSLGVWFGPDDEIVAQWQDSTQPRQVIALDRRTGRRTRTLLAPQPVPPGRPWRSVSFEAEDGQRLQGWLATPEGAGPFPAVIETHGGPESVQTDAFLPRAQVWLDHGFAYLSVNYRGSTTFGRAFKEAIWGRVGEQEVRDVVAGRRFLVEQGVAEPGLVFLTGWSYGGYITLQALGVAPDLWAGGMAGVAVADWVSEYEDENEVLRAYDRALFGGSPEERPADYERASPITYAERVAAPVLIIQGRNDSRCPARQVELYEARLRALGKPVEVLWFEAGHLAGDTERAIEHAGAMLAFARRIVAERSGYRQGNGSAATRT